MCKACRHYALEYELENYAKHAAKAMSVTPGTGPGGGLANCPLCHSPINFNPNARK
jgi:hypothetical protein